MTLLLIGGCAAKPATIDNPLSIKAAQYDDAYEAAKLVLREHGFDLDRQDYRFGRVSSQPLGAPSAVGYLGEVGGGDRGRVSRGNLGGGPGRPMAHRPRLGHADS